MKNKSRLLVIFVPLFFLSCLIPTNTQYKIDFKNNTLTIKYSDFYGDQDSLHFPDSLGFKKYSKSEKKLYGYAALLNQMIHISDTKYLDEYHKYHPGVEYTVLDKTIRKENGNLSIIVEIGMKYEKLSEDIIESVLSDLFDDVFVVDDEILILLDKEDGLIAGNGATRRSSKNHILSWKLSNLKFVIEKKTILKKNKYNDFLELFNNDGTLKKDKVPILFIKHFENIND